MLVINSRKAHGKALGSADTAGAKRAASSVFESEATVAPSYTPMHFAEDYHALESSVSIVVPMTACQRHL